MFFAVSFTCGESKDNDDEGAGNFLFSPGGIENMQIFITGGTGFIGSHLVERLLAEGHCLTVLTRSASESAREELAYLEGDPRQPGEWQKVAAAHDAVINLAGASIFQPWTEKNKQVIRDSRILTTRHIAEALLESTNGCKLLINASAVGYYGDRGDEELDEQEPPGNDFLARIAVDWEKEAERCSAGGVRVVLCRFGVVLGEDGGALAKMVPAFKLGLASPLGPGEQWFPWVHINDLVSILIFALNNRDLSGPVNCVAPQPVTNRQMTRALAKALHRPAFLPAVPAFLLKTVLGESAELVLNSHKVVPRKLQEHNYDFAYQDIQTAFRELVG